MQVKEGGRGEMASLKNKHDIKYYEYELLDGMTAKKN